MITKKVYDENTHTQKVWYDSTMILYSEMVEDEFENKGNLYITFKNGTTYVYKNVRLEDYVLFVGGGTDASQGKTLNKVIKSQYECEKIGDADIQKIMTEFNAKEEKSADIQNTYFISGHRDITDTEFEINYKPAIEYVVETNENAKFVIGDCYGVDILAQNYLVDTLNVDPDRITVYHAYNAPRNLNPKITNIRGGYSSHPAKDVAMTKDSAYDIAFVREGKNTSGTAQNILRRNELKTF